MKTNMNIETDGRLREVLREWKADAALPPRFQERVWKRIEAAEATPATAGWADWLAIIFARPAFATVCATLMLIVGLSAGFWRANRDTTRWENELAQRYVAAVDPYLGQR